MGVEAQDRDATAARLLKSSAKNSYDPHVDVDWDAPLAEGKAYMPLERVSLYGTDLWAKLTPEQRIELSKHEIASIMSVGLWFEIVLMHLLARYVFDLDARTEHAQYALTEIGDETRHSVMFARTADRLGVPRYGVPKVVHRAAKVFGATAGGPSMFASVLVAEETTDRLQRSMMDDDGIQPLIRSVNRIHVVEEARHVRFAKEEVLRTTPELSKTALRGHRLRTALVAYGVIDSMVDPRIYRSVGIDPRQGRAAALANPHFHETRRWMAGKIVPFLRDAGLIGGRSEGIWRHAHLI
jgi:para-aminobenzoate N-oxygenase AurF